MAKLKKSKQRKAKTTTGPRIPLSMIDDPRPGGSRLPEPERRTWRDLRSRFFQAEARSPEFDPRRVLRLQGQALADWRDRRRAWLQIEIFADDARVDLNQ